MHGCSVLLSDSDHRGTSFKTDPISEIKSSYAPLFHIWFDEQLSGVSHEMGKTVFRFLPRGIEINT